MTLAQKVKAAFDRDAESLSWLKVGNGHGTLDETTQTIRFAYPDGSKAVLDLKLQTFNVSQ